MKLDRCSLMAAPSNTEGLCEMCGTPRPPRRRRWCSTRCGVTFSVNHVWGPARIEALVRQGGCAICHDPFDLEVHHEHPPTDCSPYGQGCHNHQDRLQVLCIPHHAEADASRRRAAKGEPTQLTLIAA